MTNELPTCFRARVPLGSAVFEKSRIERYFASLSTAMPGGTCTGGATLAVNSRVAHAYVGTSGWGYKGWREHLYADTPVKKWLQVASRTFDALEINGSFYTQIKPETYQRWYDETPAHFNFALKGHRFVTHYKRLRDCDESITRLRDQCAPLKETLGAVV